MRSFYVKFLKNVRSLVAKDRGSLNTMFKSIVKSPEEFTLVAIYACGR